MFFCLVKFFYFGEFWEDGWNNLIFILEFVVFMGRNKSIRRENSWKVIIIIWVKDNSVLDYGGYGEKIDIIWNLS